MATGSHSETHGDYQRRPTSQRRQANPKAPFHRTRTLDTTGKDKVQQYKQSRYDEIVALAAQHTVELRTGILTLDPTERLYGVIKPTQEVQP